MHTRTRPLPASLLEEDRARRGGRSRRRVSGNEQNRTNLHRGRISRSSTLVRTLNRHEETVTTRGSNRSTNFQPIQRTENEGKRNGLRERLLHDPAAVYAALRLVLQCHDASALRGPRLSGRRAEVCSRAVQLCLHQHQLVELLYGPVQPPSAED